MDNHDPVLAQASKRPSTKFELRVTGRTNELWETTSTNQNEDYLNGFNHSENV